MAPRIAVLLLAILAMSSAGDAQTSKQRRILFVGNSITFHPALKSIGWFGEWGMAASSAENDYVYLVVAGLEKDSGVRPEFRAINAIDFERAYDYCEPAERFREDLAFRPDTVIVALGENVEHLSTETAKVKFKAAFSRLLAALKTEGVSKLIVRSSFWPDLTKDEPMREACVLAGGTFVDISEIGVEDHWARAERPIADAGVGRHPGNKGMRAIADSILLALRMK